jgi:hypothetical protein
MNLIIDAGVHRLTTNPREAAMHCPKCGAKATENQKFCRSCGMNLEAVSVLLTDHLTPSELTLLDRQRKIDRWRSFARAGTIAVGAVALTSLLIYELAIEDTLLDVLIIVIALLVVIGAAVATSLRIYSESLRGKLRRGEASGADSPLDAAPDRNTTASGLTPGALEAPPGITEHTTELLESKPVQKKE